MQAAHGGPRLLLRRLREVMAEPVSAQTRLDRIVVHIAANMVAEVCSVYVLRADGRLELYATEGLNHEAVHLTTMRADEGLVGLIAQSAESLALADAQNAVYELAVAMQEQLGAHTVDYYHRAILQQSSLVKHKRKVNPWNAFLSKQTRAKNAGMSLCPPFLSSPLTF